MRCVACVILFQSGDAPLSPECKAHIIWKGNSICIMHFNRDRSHRESYGLGDLTKADIILLSRKDGKKIVL